MRRGRNTLLLRDRLLRALRKTLTHAHRPYCCSSSSQEGEDRSRFGSIAELGVENFNRLGEFAVSNAPVHLRRDAFVVSSVATIQSAHCKHLSSGNFVMRMSSSVTSDFASTNALLASGKHKMSGCLSKYFDQSLIFIYRTRLL